MKVALTFDVEPAPHGHDPAVAERIIEVLAERGVVATFFLQGEWAEANPELAARLTRDGHRVGNHTYSHALPGQITEAELRSEVKRAEEAIERATGQSPRPYFRCPQNSGAFDSQVLSHIEAAGYRQIGWHLDSLDWEQGSTADQLASRVVAAHSERAAAGSGSLIVLLHSWPEVTAEALPGILDELIAQGAAFVTMDELDPAEIPVAALAQTARPRRHRLGASTAWGLAAKFVTVAVNFLIGVILARALGPVGKGGYALVQQIVGVLVVVLGLGLSTSNVYFVARREVTPGSAVANSVLLTGVTGLAATIACLLVITGPLAPDPPYSLAMALVAAVLFVTTTLFAWLGAIAIGLSGLRPQAIAGISSVTLVLMGAFVLWQAGLLSALFMVSLGVLGQAVASAVLLLLERGRMMTGWRLDLGAMRAMVGYSAKSYFVSLVGYLHLRQDMLILGWLAGQAAVGVYSVSTSLAEVARYIPVVLGSALFARASQVGRDEGSALSAGVSRLTVLLVLGIVAVFALFGPMLVPVVFGPTFAEAGPVLLALLPGVAAMSISEVPSSYLFSREVIYWRTSAVMVVLNAVANLIVIPRFGIMGAALASSTTYCIYSAVIVYLMKRESGFGYADILVPKARDVRAAARVLRRYATSAARRLARVFR